MSEFYTDIVKSIAAAIDSYPEIDTVSYEIIKIDARSVKFRVTVRDFDSAREGAFQVWRDEYDQYPDEHEEISGTNAKKVLEGLLPGFFEARYQRTKREWEAKVEQTNCSTCLKHERSWGKLPDYNQHRTEGHQGGHCGM